MKFDPTYDYGAEDLSKAVNLTRWKYREMLVTLITLASDAARQREILGFGSICEEMAEDYHMHYELPVETYVEAGLLTKKDRARLDELSAYLAERSGDAAPEFWDPAALDAHPDWAVVRKQARAILKSLGYGRLKIKSVRVEEDVPGFDGEVLRVQRTKLRLVKT